MTYIRNLWKSYRIHCECNQAEAQLQSLKDWELNDMGIGRGNIHSQVHGDCPWCKGK